MALFLCWCFFVVGVFVVASFSIQDLSGDVFVVVLFFVDAVVFLCVFG